jgi:hypothetical protein
MHIPSIVSHKILFRSPRMSEFLVYLTVTVGLGTEIYL